MDAFLERLGGQMVNCAIRSSIAITSKIAMQQCSRLLKTVHDKDLYAELKSLQKQLNDKIKILAPVIDLIQFKSGRGNHFLESAVPLAKSLRNAIARFEKRLEEAAAVEECTRPKAGKAPPAEAHQAELALIAREIRHLLARIDRDIPLLQTAMLGSGESMSSTLPPGVSPSRLMQASSILSFGDFIFSNDPTRAAQVGTSFTLSLYMLFVGHSKSGHPSVDGPVQPVTPNHSRRRGRSKEDEPLGWRDGERKPIWQEVMHKARVRLCRTPLDWVFDRRKGYCADTSQHVRLHGQASCDDAAPVLGRPEYSYHLEIIEDLADGRVHEHGSRVLPFDDMTMAGIRESVPIYQISKIFYTDTGQILNIGNSTDGDSNPVLLFKRDAKAPTPATLREQWMGNETDTEADSLDEQDDIEHQLRTSNGAPDGDSNAAAKEQDLESWHLPQHLDPEWLALEVFAEDDQDTDDSEDDEDHQDKDGRDGSLSNGGGFLLLPKTTRAARDRSSVNSDLIAQLRTISLRPSNPGSPTDLAEPERRRGEELGDQERTEAAQRVARSPFGTVTSSLSLLEMLVRLASLQEFQQTPHLAIPDHILTFFLEETSTTGMRGREGLGVRQEAKRKVGFDPYTDTPLR